MDQRGRFAEFDGEDAGPFCQSINLAVNNAMLGRMLALEKAPKLLYFANIEDISPRMLPDWQPRHHHPEDRMPLFGLLQNTRVTADGMCCLIVVLGLGTTSVSLAFDDVVIRLLCSFYKWLLDCNQDGRGQIVIQEEDQFQF